MKTWKTCDFITEYRCWLQKSIFCRIRHWIWICIKTSVSLIIRRVLRIFMLRNEFGGKDKTARASAKNYTNSILTVRHTSEGYVSQASICSFILILQDEFYMVMCLVDKPRARIWQQGTVQDIRWIGRGAPVWEGAHSDKVTHFEVSQEARI